MTRQKATRQKATRQKATQATRPAVQLQAVQLQAKRCRPAVERVASERVARRMAAPMRPAVRVDHRQLIYGTRWQRNKAQRISGFFAVLPGYKYRARTPRRASYDSRKQLDTVQE
jgi:hypothetical protein